MLLVNSSAGDRCIRFHETAALRRICRTRLDLPPPPRSSLTDGQGLFDVLALFEKAAATETVVGSTECSLLDLVFLPEVSVLLGLVGGKAEVRDENKMCFFLLKCHACLAEESV